MPTPMKLKPDRSRVEITEKAPKAEQVVHDLEAIRAVIKQLERQLKARNSRRRANETGRNRSQRQDAQQGKATARKIADGLMREDRTLRDRRKTNELAERIRRRWPPNRKPPSVRTLCRYLTG